MNRKLVACIIMCLAIGGCKSDDDDNQPAARTWSVEFLVADAATPVMSPDGSAFLFLREGSGLFLWQDGIESRVTPESVTARPDYSWSLSGEAFFAFSIPGLPDGEAGVYVSGAGSVLNHVWDRGSSPAFIAAQNAVYCAGPEASATDAGIWRINTANLDSVPVRLTETGLAPQLGNLSQTLAYLVPTIASNASLFTARGISDLELLVEIPFVARFQCAKNSDTILIEIVADSEGLARPPAIYKTTAASHSALELVAQPATNMVLLENGAILFNRLSGDQMSSLILRHAGHEYVLSDTLYAPSARSSNVILAAGPAGISRLTEN